jgi:pimeloyl-ACP methyl ester carboxylesterase
MRTKWRIDRNRSGCPITSVRNDPESLWNSLNGESFVLNLDDVDAALQQAIEAARASAGSAQQRWSAQDDADRERWMICWAAHVDDERVEYLWVDAVHLVGASGGGHAAQRTGRTDAARLASGDLVFSPPMNWPTGSTCPQATPSAKAAPCSPSSNSSTARLVHNPQSGPPMTRHAILHLA